MLEAARFRATLLRQEIGRRKEYFLPEDGKNTFDIRSHHLQNYIILFLGNKRTPQQVAQSTIATYKQLLESEPSRYERVADTVGTTPEDFAKRAVGERRRYEEFIRLPSSFPVEIKENMPDELCKLCPVGAHCKTKYMESGEERTADHLWMDLFLERARDINPYLFENGSIIEELEEATYSDADPEKVRVVKTTAGVMRYIFSNW